MQLVRGILQLLEEWEYHFALTGVAHQSVKAMLAKTVDAPSRQSYGEPGEPFDRHQEQARGLGMSLSHPLTLFFFINEGIYLCVHVFYPLCLVLFVSVSCSWAIHGR